MTPLSALARSDGYISGGGGLLSGAEVLKPVYNLQEGIIGRTSRLQLPGETNVWTSVSPPDDHDANSRVHLPHTINVGAEFDPERADKYFAREIHQHSGVATHREFRRGA